MAWPGNFNNWNNFGSGVDHAPPPPPPGPNGMGPFANPEFWQRCFEQRGGWDDWNPEQHHRGPHGRRGRHGGRRGQHGPGGEGHHSATDNEDFPPEYIDDEEVAEAVAEGEKGREKEADGADSPDTTMRELTPTSDDPPEGVPSEDEGRRQRGGPGRHGSFGRRGRGGHGPHGRGEHRRHGSGPRGFHHHHGPPPPFFGGMFGGPGGGPRGPPGQHNGPPLPPFLEALFGGGPSPRGGPGGPGGPHGRHPHGPPPPPPFEGLFGGGPGPRGGPGGPHGPHGPHGPPPPPPDGPAGPGSPFDFQPWVAMLANHPFAKNVREYLERAQDGVGRPGGAGGAADAAASFTPPLDLFEQGDKWVLHVAVPGAKKEDAGVSWDADRGVLSVSGVVHRPGDEEFLRGLVSGERSTGLFSREVRLPPAMGSGGGGRQESSSKEEVNAEGIEAKMEDGILIVTVPKVERGWTEVKKVDIQ